MRLTTGAIFFCLAFGTPFALAQQSSEPEGSPTAHRVVERTGDSSLPGNTIVVTEPAVAADIPAGTIDDFIRARCGSASVPGLSLAIIQDGKIVKAKGYGVTEKGGDNPGDGLHALPGRLDQQARVGPGGAATGGTGQARPG